MNRKVDEVLRTTNGGMKVSFLACLLFAAGAAVGQKTMALANGKLQLEWTQTAQGWRLQTVKVKKGSMWLSAGTPSGEHSLLYSEATPANKPDKVFKTNTGGPFPEPSYHKQLKGKWDECTTPVALNTAGQAYHFFPSAAQKLSNKIIFTQRNEVGIVITEWRLDGKYPSDILITQKLTASKDGWYSLATPTLLQEEMNNLEWVTVPGYFQGNKLNDDFVSAYGYGHGIPSLPVIYRERAASTLSPMMTSKAGITTAVIPNPSLGRDPWAADKSTHRIWSIGLSHMNRRSQLSPTLYYPVLGQPGSQLKAGESVSYSFRYSLGTDGWFAMLNHAVYDVFRFGQQLALRQNKTSLTRRMERIHDYVVKPQTSLWKTDEFEGKTIGAQAYLGAVVGSQKDAVKNSDYGAMWMLASLSADTALTQGRLPYAMNFKLAQQEGREGFFKGAVRGQYYLYKTDKWVEEWGSIMEPIGVTYYSLVDMANILLFERNNNDLRARIRASANLLLQWQKPDGSWVVAYDHETKAEVYADVKDLRPTFYGLLVAWQVLKDEKYLAAAKKGADWYIKNAVATGSFLGVCGDMRYAPDFATAQSAQALLELFDATGEGRYKEAAITAAKIYTTSIYTHPIANKKIKTVNGKRREDWEISQSGLSYEHGGILGSTNSSGPIQLCSHAGMFLRMYQLTNEPLFRDMARAAAIGRDAFVDSATSVASYYWAAMDKGPGPFPHHAWWQVGWITDYLVSEAALRSNNQIRFPRGYITPKVGPHQTYGFAAGVVFGDSVQLISTEGLVTCNNPQVEYIAAKSIDGKRVHLVLMNNSGGAQSAVLTWGDVAKPYRNMMKKDGSGKVIGKASPKAAKTIALKPYELQVLTLE